ncbi:hypothetical protein OH77DRAFT_1431843 [Trametes cingulata]|nr:hypothetical protein OH77DRAFT_1431843 [Trametes cingulata]
MLHPPNYWFVTASMLPKEEGVVVQRHFATVTLVLVSFLEVSTFIAQRRDHDTPSGRLKITC